MLGFLQDTFLRFGGGFVDWDDQSVSDPPCSKTLTDAVEYVVDETANHLRAVPGYARQLKEPVTTAFLYIDQLVENMPDVVSCSGASFAKDPRVNAFFVNRHHLQKVFSQSKEVRDVFNENPEIDQCFALLCMRKEERRHMGMALVNDEVQKDVMQTSVSFTDHQIISPGASETEARRALKCCIFSGLLTHIRHWVSNAKNETAEFHTQLTKLKSQLKKLGLEDESLALRAELINQIGDLEKTQANKDLHLDTLNGQLQFVVDALRKPEQFLSGTTQRIYLSRLGVKLEGNSDVAGYELILSEMKLASHRPRVTTLVCFPKDELLPENDMLNEADLFLAG